MNEQEKESITRDICGTELFEKVRSRISRKENFMNQLGIQLDEISRGSCKMSMEIREDMLNSLDTVHGGCLYTLADAAAGYASATMGQPGPTISGDMYFIRPVIGAKKLICDAEVVKAGTHINVVEVSLKNEKGSEVACATLQYMQLSAQQSLEKGYQQRKLEDEDLRQD